MRAYIDSFLRARVRVRVRECVRAHTRGSSARPLDVCHCVHECMRLCMYMDFCIGAHLERI